MRTCSIAIRREADGLRLDLGGDLRGGSTDHLRRILLAIISTDPPNELLITLHDVTGLDQAGVEALVGGYVTAIEHGVRYRVVGAQGASLRALQATGTLELIADSDDVGELLHALIRPDRDAPRRSTIA
jgi:anti-anti-sigma factor